MKKSNIKTQLILSQIYKYTHSFSFQCQGIEFICPLKSKSIVTYDDNSIELNPGNVLMLPPTTQITIKTVESAVVLRTTINYSFFIKSFPVSYTQLQCNSLVYPDKDYAPLLCQLAKLTLICSQNNSDRNFQLLSILYKLFELLRSTYLDHSISSTSFGKQEKKILDIKEYIHGSYQQQITLQDVADSLDLTPQYLASFIKKQLNKTFLEILQEVRFEHALAQLEYTNDTPLKIAVDNGYPNLTAYNKSFHDITGSSPLSYRLNLQSTAKGTEEGDFILIHNLALLKEYLSENIFRGSDEPLIDSIESEQYSILCDVNKTSPLNPTWKDLINLGFAKNFDKPDFRQQLQVFQDTLHFNYGRVQGIFELVNIYHIGERIDYDFRRVFNVIDHMKSVNLKPHFEIGNKSINIYKESLNDAPQDTTALDDTYYDYLKHYLPVFLSYCINRYGFDEVSTWRFELWRQYNNALTNFESPIRYMNRFRYVYQTIKKYVPRSKVGGPGHNTFADIVQLKEVLSELKKYDIVPDFISSLVYPYEQTKDNQVILSLRHDIYQKRINEVIHLLHELGINSPCYITEYSSFMSSWNCFNDSNYQASFIIRETLNNSENLAALGYWILSDTAFEYKNARGILFGGNGLISRDGINKPGFYAFKFLETLGQNMVSKGENYIITSSSDRNLQVILFNYCYFTEHYCLNLMQYQLIQYPFSAFEDKMPLSFDIDIHGLPKGKYRVREHILNQEYGSLLNEWQKMQEFPDLSNSEIDYLKHVSIPHTRVNFVDIKDHLPLSTRLYSNDIMLIEIDYYI